MNAEFARDVLDALKDEPVNPALSVERIEKHRRNVERHRVFSAESITELLDEIDRLRGLLTSFAEAMRDE